jgi:hypothetical protein
VGGAHYKKALHERANILIDTRIVFCNKRQQ